MTQSTEQERAEFVKVWRHRPENTGHDHEKELAFIWWQAARRAQVVPVGWKLVPVEPTAEMLDAIDLLCDDLEAFEDSQAFWNYLIEAAPQPPEAQSNCANLEQLNKNNDLAAPVQKPEPKLTSRGILKALLGSR